jgi:hypothetical protein
MTGFLLSFLSIFYLIPSFIKLDSPHWVAITSDNVTQNKYIIVPPDG